MVVPPIVLFLARHPMVSNFDLSSVYEVLSAAAPLGESLTNEFAEKIKIPLYQGTLYRDLDYLVADIFQKDFNFFNNWCMFN